MLDDFNRADENPLSDGGAWSILAATYPLKVSANRLACLVGGLTCDAWRTDVRYGVDQEAWMTVEVEPAVGQWARLYVRLQKPSVFDGYAVRFVNQSGTDQVLIERVSNGGYTTLQTFYQEFLQGDKLRVRTVGSTIEAWRRDNNTGLWAKMGEATDATYVGVGYVGVALNGSVARADDFGVTTLRDPIPDPAVTMDDFNRADENPLSDGGAWSTLAATYPLKVSSNRLACLVGGLTCDAWRTDAPYTANQEAWMTIEVEPAVGQWARLYVRLQTPSAFSGYAVGFINESGTDRVLIERVSNGTHTTLRTYYQEFVQGDKLRVRAVGSTIEAWRRDNYTGLWSKLDEATDSTYLAPGYLGVALNGSVARADDFGGGNATASLDPDYLLNRYAPEVRYDILDTFRADSASMMTNNDPPGDGTSNVLWDGDGVPLASAEPMAGLDLLNLDYLGLTYPQGGIAQGRAATTDDYVNAENSYSEDADRMQVAPGRMYGRVLPETSGRWTLQYWFFYYFNWHPEMTNVGDHEGDWEMVQFELDSFGIPTGATYSQHDRGERCPWPSIDKTTAGKPIVYVARGSHASYFRPGFKTGTQVGNGVGDYVGGDLPAVPSVEEINPPAPAWLDWPGRWGASTGDGFLEFASPRGPAFAGEKWYDPLTWAEDQGGCWEVSSSRTTGIEVQLPSPPAPKIVATRAGQRVRIAYSFPTWPTGMNRRPVMLLTVVRSSDPRSSGVMRRHRISTRTGVVSQPIGRGKGPYKVFAAAYSASGRSSSTVTARVRTP